VFKSNPNYTKFYLQNATWKQKYTENMDNPGSVPLKVGPNATRLYSSCYMLSMGALHMHVTHLHVIGIRRITCPLLC